MKPYDIVMCPLNRCTSYTVIILIIIICSKHMCLIGTWKQNLMDHIKDYFAIETWMQHYNWPDGSYTYMVNCLNQKTYSYRVTRKTRPLPTSITIRFQGGMLCARSMQWSNIWLYQPQIVNFLATYIQIYESPS